MQDISRKQIENMSDEDLKSLLKTCTEISEHRKYQKLHDERQVFCDLYENAWVKLKFKFDDSDDFENRFMLVHIDKVHNVYNISNADNVTIVADFIEQYHIDMFDTLEVDVRHIVANNDPESINNITFETDDVIEFVKPEQVKKIVNAVINKLN